MRLLLCAPVVMAAIGLLTEAHAQSRSDFLYLQDRVERLERQPGSGGNPQSEAELSLRISQLEAEVRALRGQVDEATFLARQLDERLRRFQEDTEYRFRELQGGGITVIPDDTPPTEAAGEPAREAGDGPAFSEDTLGARPLDLSALSGGTVGATDGEQVAIAMPSDPRTEFELGYSLIITRDYPGAERVFREFIARFPTHELATDAQYWIGESQFQRGTYRDAANTFLGIYDRQPNSPQAAPSLLRLAQSLNQLGERDAACSATGEVREKFAASVPEVAERANREARRWGC